MFSKTPMPATATRMFPNPFPAPPFPNVGGGSVVVIRGPQANTLRSGAPARTVAEVRARAGERARARDERLEAIMARGLTGVARGLRLHPLGTPGQTAAQERKTQGGGAPKG